MKKLLWLLPLTSAFILITQSCSTESTPVYQLTTSTEPSEAGSVSQSAREANEGESITITATPNEHWVFNGWIGDHTGSDNPASVVMHRDKNVTAMFQKRDYPLTIEIDGKGSVDERVLAQKTSEHPYGTIVELTAIPDEGWTFIHWSGDYEGKEKTIEVTVDGPVMISVAFEQVEHRYEGDEQEFEATSSGEIVVIAPVDNPDYEQVNFDFSITYDDESETPVEGARVVVDQRGDIFWIRIEGLGEDDGRVLIAGTPDEILEMLQQGVNKQHYGHITIDQDAGLIISGALIIGAAIKIYKAYKIYKSARAIWDLAFDAYRITAHFSDGVRAADGGRLFCKPLTEVEDLAKDLQSLAISSGSFVISLALPKAEVSDGFKLLEAVANDVGQTLDKKIEDYLADLIIDQASHHLGVEEIFGIRLYYPWDLDISDDEGRRPGFIQVIPNDPECNFDKNWPRDNDTEVVEVTSPTGRVWMDRNLGASRAATSMTDPLAYGDLYQWGRAADGHQRRNSPTTSTLSSSDLPGHSNFIVTSRSSLDWRSPQNNNLWQGVNGINNPCPSGYRIATDAEWEVERQSWSNSTPAGAFRSPLKLPMAGIRDLGSGSLLFVDSNGFYWSSTISGSNARSLTFNSSDAFILSYARASGYSVRCLKN